MFQIKRILMNAADTGSGNGAAPVPSATDNVPQAQGDAVTLSQAELDAKIAAAADKAVAAVKDSIYAEARRTFAGSKKDKPSKDPDATPQQAPAVAQLSATEERAYLRGLDRYIATKGLAPNASQYERAEKALLGERPESVESWAADYFDGWGAAKPQPAQTQAAPSTRPATEHPMSNRGAPPPAQTPIEEIDLFTATDSDRKAFIAAKGPKAYVAALQKQAKGRTVKFT